MVDHRGLTIGHGKGINWLGRWTHQKPPNVEKLSGYFLKAPDLSQAQDSIIIGKKGSFHIDQ